MVAVLNPSQLESEEMSRITALCTRVHPVEDGVGDMPGLMEEVSVDYLRTMNKIVLEAQTREVSGDTAPHLVCLDLLFATQLDHRLKGVSRIQ